MQTWKWQQSYRKQLWGWLRQNMGYVFSTCVLAASLCLNLVLGWRLMDLRTPPLTMLPAVSRTGAQKDLRFDHPTLLYVFSPACRWCSRDHQNLLALHEARGLAFRFVAVTKDVIRLEEYLNKNPFPFDVVLADRSRISGALETNLSATPQTVVIREGGIVEKAWIGALFGPRKTEVEAYFGVRLPGITADPGDSSIGLWRRSDIARKVPVGPK